MTDNLMKFMDFVSKNEEAREELKALSAELTQEYSDELVKLAAKYGFTLTTEDFRPAKMEELSEDELGAVAGGEWCGEPSFSCAIPVWYEMVF